jgi:hypothetical protein
VIQELLSSVLADISVLYKASEAVSFCPPMLHSVDSSQIALLDVLWSFAKRSLGKPFRFIRLSSSRGFLDGSYGNCSSKMSKTMRSETWQCDPNSLELWPSNLDATPSLRPFKWPEPWSPMMSMPVNLRAFRLFKDQCVSLVLSAFQL